MNKAALLKLIISALTDQLALLDKAARASHAEATHESSKAENKYDTRGLEAAYLAGGQARQIRELTDAIEQFEKLPVRPFSAAHPIDLGALVELDMNGERTFYFIGPKSGGLEINYQRKEILVITPQSPLGQNLIGKKSGECWTAEFAAQSVKYQILTVA